MPKRCDENQSEIVKTFRKLGALVHVTSMLGKGFPDIIISINNKIWLIEIKNGKKPPSQQLLTPAEKKFHSIWSKHVVIINSIQQAIDLVNQKN